MDIKELTKFLIARKTILLESEKRAIGTAKKQLIAQIQVIETILIFVNQTKNGDNNMSILELALDEQARPLSEIKPRERKSELTNELVKLANSLPPGTYKRLNTEKVKGRSIVAKIYALKKKGILPDNISPMQKGSDFLLANRGK